VLQVMVCAAIFQPENIRSVIGFFDETDHPLAFLRKNDAKLHRSRAPYANRAAVGIQRLAARAWSISGYRREHRSGFAGGAAQAAGSCQA